MNKFVGGSNAEKEEDLVINASSPLFQHIPTIIFALHSVYQELKLQTAAWDNMEHLASLLRIFTDLSISEYVFSDDRDQNLVFPPYWTDKPWDIFRHVENNRYHNELVHLTPVSHRTAFVLLLYWLMEGRSHINTGAFNQTSSLNGVGAWRDRIAKALTTVTPYASPASNVLRCLESLSLTPEHLMDYPCGIVIPILDAICRGGFKLELRYCALKSSDILSLRFPEDVRVSDVGRMLDSSIQTRIYIPQQGSLSEEEVRDAQRTYLVSAALRTMALPIGRGMMNYHSKVPYLGEQVSIAPLCLSGKAPPNGVTINLTAPPPPTRTPSPPPPHAPSGPNSTMGLPQPLPWHPRVGIS